jgi:hypothetical protein
LFGQVWSRESEEHIMFGVTAALVLVYGTFHLNRTYGEHGLMKAQARRNHPRYVINRRSIFRLFHRFPNVALFFIPIRFSCFPNIL